MFSASTNGPLTFFGFSYKVDIFSRNIIIKIECGSRPKSLHKPRILLINENKMENGIVKTPKENPTKYQDLNSAF